MKAKTLRLPEDLLDAIKFAEKKEKIDEPATLRKFLRLGAEKYVADRYARGDISLVCERRLTHLILQQEEPLNSSGIWE